MDRSSALPPTPHLTGPSVTWKAASLLEPSSTTGPCSILLGELITSTHPMHLTPSRDPCWPPGQVCSPEEDTARTVLVLSPCAPPPSLHFSTGHFMHTRAANGGQAKLVIRVLKGSCCQQVEGFSLPAALTSKSQVVNS